MKRNDFIKQYQSKEWYEISKRIKARDNNTCQMCGRNDVPLSVHHLYYPKEGIIKIDDFSLITLCEDCHKLQRESKDNIREELEILRAEYTDYEILCILKSLHRTHYEEKPFPHIEAVVIDSLSPDECPDSYLRYLSKWRERINM